MNAPVSETTFEMQISSKHRLTMHARAGMAMLALLSVLLFACELSIGEVSVPLAAILDALLGRGTEPAALGNIILEFRLPRALNAVFSGAALGVAGVLLQTLFRNPLADPFILGIVQTARLGAAALVVATGVFGATLVSNTGLFGDIGLALASIAGCVAILVMLTVLSKRVSTTTLLICGLMLGYFAVGMISAILHFVDENQARAFKAWDDASFAGATWELLRLLIPGVIIGIVGVLALAKPLNGLLLGEAYAQTLGVPVVRVKRLALGAAAWLCGLVTAFCGPVSFLGLVAAQIARGLLQTSDHRVLLPAAAWIGAVVALAADLVTHLPLPHHVFHLNAVIGLVGAPVALFVLLRSKALRAFEG